MANSLNLSISTVSKALKNSPEISQRTKDRVVELARLKSYIPNVSAQILKGRKTGNIGVILPSLADKKYVETLQSMEKQMASKGYHLILCLSDEAFKKEVKCVHKLIRSQVDGIIIWPSMETITIQNFSHLDKVKKNGKALVLLRPISDNTCSKKLSSFETMPAEEIVLDLNIV